MGVMMSVTKRALLCLVLFAVSVTGAVAGSVTNERLSPSLWKVTLNGQQGYLFGTIHFGHAAMYPLPDAIYKRLDRSDVLVLEADIRPEAQVDLMPVMQQAGFDPETPLAQQLAPETNRKLMAYAQENQLPLTLMATMKPWMASTTITIIQLQRLGYSAEQGIEYHLMSRANKKNIGLAFLETAAYQIGVLSSMSMVDQEYMLLSTLEADDKSMHAMIAAWQHGDVEQFMSAYMGDMDARFVDRFNQLFLQDRNVGMADGIVALLKDGKSPFVAIGAAHLFGEKSVIELLQKQNVKVTALRY